MNIVDTLLSQYANSPTILSLLTGIQEAIDPSNSVDDFYSFVYNLNTAQGYGLDVWGRIVGINRNVPAVLGTDDQFGFADGYTPFNDAPFAAYGAKFSSFSLPDTLYRQLIIIKAYANIIYATAPNINAFLKYIFQKRAYYRVLGNMHAQYVFEFAPTDFEKLIINNLGILPMPCGVSVEYTVIAVEKTFGFNGSNLQTFNNGTFRP